MRRVHVQGLLLPQQGIGTHRKRSIDEGVDSMTNEEYCRKCGSLRQTEMNSLLCELSDVLNEVLERDIETLEVKI